METCGNVSEARNIFKTAMSLQRAGAHWRGQWVKKSAGAEAHAPMSNFPFEINGSHLGIWFILVSKSLSHPSQGLNLSFGYCVKESLTRVNFGGLWPYKI